MSARLLPVLFLALAAIPALAADLVFPALTGRVVDDAGILSASSERHIDGKLREYEKESGNQVVVVTLPSLQGTTIEDFAVHLARHWGIGTAERNDGLLLIVAPNQRKVRIEVGYGLEGTVTDAEARIIIENIILPAFRSGNMQGGITSGVQAILDVLAGGDPPTGPPHEEEGSSITWIIVGAFLALILLVAVLSDLANRKSARNDYWGHHDPSWYGHGGSHHHRPSSWSGGASGSSGSGGFGGGGGGFGGGGASGGW